MFNWFKKLFGYEDQQVIPAPPITEPVVPRIVQATGFGRRFDPQPEPQVQYATHPKAVIVACFFNPENNPYRILAFQKWYHSIKHMPHRIIECLIGDANWQLPVSASITHVQTDSLLFHKESLLNKVIAELPTEFEYVFWLDTDVLFTNPNWLVEGVEALQTCAIIQPFEYCIHLKRNQIVPDFNVDNYRNRVGSERMRHPDLWKSFCSIFVVAPNIAKSDKYDLHGHVGFAWGARREVLDKVQLYDRALAGGADHIVAHAAAGHIPCGCINRAFTLEIDDVVEWSKEFADVVGGRVGFVKGDCYHIWHGNIEDREYLKRIKEFAQQIQFITRRDSNGLWIYDGNDPYMKRYYQKREAVALDDGSYDFSGFDVGFVEDMGYMLTDLFVSFGQSTYNDDLEETPVDSTPDVATPDVATPDVATPQIDTSPDPIKSITPSYEPGHWDYTPPDSDPANTDNAPQTSSMGY